MANSKEWGSEREQHRLRHITSIQVANLSPHLLEPPKERPDLTECASFDPTRHSRSNSQVSDITISPPTSGKQLHSRQISRSRPVASTSRTESSISSSLTANGSTSYHDHDCPSQQMKERLENSYDDGLFPTLLTLSPLSSPTSSPITKASSFTPKSTSSVRNAASKPKPKDLRNQNVSSQSSRKVQRNMNRSAPKSFSSNANMDTVSANDLKTPFFISQVHRPSTNPQFSNIDAPADFADWVDSASSFLAVVLWGRIDAPNPLSYQQETECSFSEWFPVAEWQVNLQDMHSIPHSAVGTNEALPPNTLLLRFSGSSHPFYQLHPSQLCTNEAFSAETVKSDHFNPIEQVQASEDPRDRPGSRRLKKRSTHRQQLFSLLSAQSLLQETREDLDTALAHCERLVIEDNVSRKRRRLSQLAQLEQQLKSRLAECRRISRDLQQKLTMRQPDLSNRYDNLEASRNLSIASLDKRRHREKELNLLKAREQDKESEIERHRGMLFSALSSIFPIELISTSDLLFGVLDVPLPIPTHPTDPAPPLVLDSVPRMNAETVASAFGHVAQIVQLSAAYMSINLSYPITCIGSRSNVKDPISLMMGPRRFPLYAKGVDSYRFEYAVYLLNKDIETLMSLRELRSTDIRHTLPNLKNFLLTVSSGSGMSWNPPCPASDPNKLHNGFREQSPPSSPVQDAMPTDEQSHSNISSRTWSSLSFSASWSLFRSRDDSKTKTGKESEPVNPEPVEAEDGTGGLKVERTRTMADNDLRNVIDTVVESV